jgi:hypothetical protein
MQDSVRKVRIIQSISSFATLYSQIDLQHVNYLIGNLCIFVVELGVREENTSSVLCRLLIWDNQDSTAHTYSKVSLVFNLWLKKYYMDYAT